MWKNPNFTLPSVFIVENDSGEVFIVEDKTSKPEIEKILQPEKVKNPPSTSRKKAEIRKKPRSPSPVPVK
jgi:hypothetical protein